MVQQLETIAGGGFCRALESSYSFKSGASKLNNHEKFEGKKMSEINLMSLLWLEIPPQSVLIITWRPMLCA